MIRKVTTDDVEAIADIYNNYIGNSTATFETERISVNEMRKRIEEISSAFPYFVDEEEGEIAGYCYAHPWKARAAYRYTLETSVYLDPKYFRRGIGRNLMENLIRDCRAQGFHTLIACITEGNTASYQLHESLGFRQVSDFHEVGMKFGRWLGVVDYELLL
jgi:L-amino acid N-acyltransferase YncA